MALTQPAAAAVGISVDVINVGGTHARKPSVSGDKQKWENLQLIEMFKGCHLMTSLLQERLSELYDRQSTKATRIHSLSPISVTVLTGNCSKMISKFDVDEKRGTCNNKSV